MKENSINVCHIVSRINGRADGIFKHLLAQFNLLNGKQFRHVLITPYSQEIEHVLQKLGIKTFFIPSIDSKSYFTALKEIHKILKNSDFDIICCHTLKPLVFGGYLNLFNKKKIIFFSHGIFLNNDYNSFLEKIIYKVLLELLFHIKKIQTFCPSQWNKNKLEAEFGKKINAIVYYDGKAVVSSSEEQNLNNNLIEEIKKIDTEFKIIFVGRIAREKNPLLAIKIFEKLDYPNISLHFFGEGELENILKNYVYKNNLKNVFFHGFVPNAKAYFNYFNLLLLTSDREGMPIVIWEALNEGLPFVSRNVGGISEILKFGQCGFVFNTVDEAVEKIKLFIIDRKIWEESSSIGKLIINRYFNENRFIEFFKSYYLNPL
ncbi:MAG: glycosyltransferase [Ignavibacterium sp.]|nr:glycosyltransferase [Ignavibacterium sp.]